jgi:hypothetical protein
LEAGELKEEEKEKETKEPGEGEPPSLKNRFSVPLLCFVSS